MKLPFLEFLRSELGALEAQGLYKSERVIDSPAGRQRPRGRRTRCSTSAPTTTSGLANHPALVAAATAGARRATATAWPRCASSAARRTCTASSRRGSPRFLGTEDTILYGSCFDANGGLFETLLGEEDAVISDALNHASIIDGVRLCKAKRFRYANNDMADLEAQLKAAEADGARFKLIATDGVFSMDGIIANLRGDLRPRRQATARMVMVDDSHAVGFVGAHGPRHARALRRDGPGRHPHRHARQGAGRRLRRLHLGPSARSSPGCATLAPVPLLQHAHARHRRRLAQGARPARGAATSCARSCARNAEHFRSEMTQLGLQARPARATRSSR